MYSREPIFVLVMSEGSHANSTNTRAPKKLGISCKKKEEKEEKEKDPHEENYPSEEKRRKREEKKMKTHLLVLQKLAQVAGNFAQALESLLVMSNLN